MNIPTYDRRARKWHFTHQHRGGFRLFPVSSEEQVVHRSMVLDDPGASTRDGLKKWWKRCLVQTLGVWKCGMWGCRGLMELSAFGQCRRQMSQKWLQPWNGSETIWMNRKFLQSILTYPMQPLAIYLRLGRQLETESVRSMWLHMPVERPVQT